MRKGTSPTLGDRSNVIGGLWGSVTPVTQERDPTTGEFPGHAFQEETDRDERAVG
jgi:hypothetical protein